MMKFILGSFNFIVVNILVRFLPTRIAVALVKRMKVVDLRRAWGLERLSFLYSRRLPINIKMIGVAFYYYITPKGYGVSWGCGMESAFRLSSLLDLSRNADLDLTHWMEWEYDFLAKNIEWHTNNNHLLVCLIVAHVYVALYKSGEEDNYLPELILELNKQFHPDGTNFEASTAYHLLALSAVLWLRKHSPIDNLSKMVNLDGALKFARLIAKPDAWAWIGDNDSSIIGGADFFQGCVLSEKTAEGQHSFNFFSAVIWKYSGYKLGLWSADFSKLGHAGHKHDDWASLTLAINGSPLFIDPGVLTYSQRRREMRSRGMHNAPEIRKFAKGFIEYAGSFKGDSKFHSELWVGENEAACYLTLGGEEVLRRHLILEGASFIVTDVSYAGDAQVNWLVNSSEWNVLKSERKSFSFIHRETGVSVSLLILGEIGSVYSENIFWSPAYLKSRQARKLTVRFSGKLSWKVVFSSP